MNSRMPPLAVTLGDPSGIGPEIVVRTLMKEQEVPAVVLGAEPVLRRAVDLVAPDMRVVTLSNPSEVRNEPGTLFLIETGGLDQVPDYGQVTAAGGAACFRAIAEAIDLARKQAVSGIVTAPIHKEALAAAGIRYPGHTEILADRGGADRVAMMLVNDEIRTVLATIHCSLRDAIDKADFDAQMAAMRLARDGARAFGIDAPRVAVAGLNPHAGEGGLFGREEIEIITPAIEAAKAEGIDASGPWPGDTVFMQARQGRFDVVVAQYHDQGLIPVKYLGLEKGVNVTLGLPFVRTSPDHGTAYDIAGRGIADPASLETALTCAARMAAVRFAES